MNSLNAARKGTLTYGLEHSARRYRRSVRHAALPLDQSPLPSGFAQFPSAHFLPNTALNTDDKQVTSLDTNDKQALVLNRTQLNWLLATFGERDGLLAQHLYLVSRPALCKLTVSSRKRKNQRNPRPNLIANWTMLAHKRCSLGCRHR